MDIHSAGMHAHTVAGCVSTSFNCMELSGLSNVRPDDGD